MKWLCFALLLGAISGDYDGVAENLELESCVGPQCIPRGRGAKCNQVSNCHQCTMMSSCGWCASTKMCHFGGLAGPVGLNCSYWEYSFCSGEPCAVFTNCINCVANPFCGWCETDQVCQEGSPSAPLFGECEMWSKSGCPRVVSPLEDFTD
eukprot:c8875_g1_i1.p1 GENE.c8875_g1_i1~~c8875_g1_i1.p1  ORF type:complete len:151 (+),score=12.95 c8875_g1_i1:39-491(+)